MDESSTRDEDSCSSDTDGKIADPPKKVRMLAIEEPATVVAPPSVKGNIVRHRSSHRVSSEVTGPPSKIPKLDEVTTPWKGSTSKLCTVTSQQSSASTAHEGEQVCVMNACNEVFVRGD